MARCWNQAVALSRKNLTYQKRHLLSNLRLVLFPAVLFLLLGGLRRFQLKNADHNLQPAEMSNIWIPLLVIPAAEYRAVKTELMPFDELPDQSCRIKGSCPVLIFVTANNRTFAQSVAEHIFPNYSAKDTSYSQNNISDGVFRQHVFNVDMCGARTTQRSTMNYLKVTIMGIQKGR